MDIAFTITVWILLVGLSVRGLRLTQAQHAQGAGHTPARMPAVAAPAPPAVPEPLLPDHPVSSSVPAVRELIGAGS